MSAAIYAVFVAMVTLPGIGLTFFPQETCTAFSMTAITASTRHMSRLIGVRNLAFGITMLLTRRGSAANRTTIVLAAATEGVDIIVSGMSFYYRDMDQANALQSGGAAAAAAVMGYLSL